MKKYLLILLLVQTNLLIAQDKRDVFVGCYNYTDTCIQYYPPPLQYSHYNGIFCLIKSSIDSTQIIFADSINSNYVTFTCTQDSFMTWDPNPFQYAYGQIYPNDSIIITFEDYSGVGLNSICTYYTKKTNNDIEEILENMFLIYPNPINDYIQVILKTNFKNLKIELFNIRGQEVLEKEYQNINSSFQIDVSHLSGGLYFLKLSADENSFSQKIVISK